MAVSHLDATLSADDQTPRLWTQLYPRQFSASYAAANAIWLQVDEHVWDVASIDQVIQNHGGPRSASYDLLFRDGARTSVVLSMPRNVLRQRLIDPTYDETASWSDDIMKSLPYVAADGWKSNRESVESWRERMLPIWQRGFKHST